MRTFPVGFFNASTRCLIAKVVRKDGTIFGFTDSDHDFDWDGVTYKHLDGMTQSTIIQESGTSADNGELQTLASGRITVGDLAASLYENARVYAYEIDYTNVDQGPMPLVAYRITRVKAGDTINATEIADLLSLLKNQIGDTFEQECIAPKPWGKRCDPSGTLAAGFTFARTVTNVVDDFSFDVSDSHTIPYYSFGYGSWTSGANNGVPFDVLRETNPSGGVIRIFLRTPMGYQVAVGDTVNLTRGCDRKKATCKMIPNTHNATATNIENFQSVDLPNPDLIKQIGRQPGA